MVQYQVSFVDAIKRAFKQYCVFTGRASRSEFWWFFLFTNIIGVVLYIPVLASLPAMMAALQTGQVPEQTGLVLVFQWIFYIVDIALFLPSMGLLFRRLHDSGRSGWNWLWSFLPVAGWIVLIVLLCQPSEPEANKYGPVPNVME